MAIVVARCVMLAVLGALLGCAGYLLWYAPGPASRVFLAGIVTLGPAYMAGLIGQGRVIGRRPAFFVALLPAIVGTALAFRFDLVFALVLNAAGIVLVACLPRKVRTVACPWCAERVRPERTHSKSAAKLIRP